MLLDSQGGLPRALANTPTRVAAAATSQRPPRSSGSLESNSMKERPSRPQSSLRYRLRPAAS
eukprot:14454443-Alexandrium_andersonii.AAC.1